MPYTPSSLSRAKSNARELQVMLSRCDLAVPLMKCQHAVARMMGHPSWHVLKKRVDAGELSEGFDDDSTVDLSARRRMQSDELAEAFGVGPFMGATLAGYLAVTSRTQPIIRVGDTAADDAHTQDLRLPCLEALPHRIFDPLELDKHLPDSCDTGLAGSVLDAARVGDYEDEPEVPDIILTRDPAAWQRHIEKLREAYGPHAGVAIADLSFLRSDSPFDPFLVIDPRDGAVIGSVVVARYAVGVTYPGHAGLGWRDRESIRADGNGETHARLVHEHCQCSLLPGYRHYAIGLGMLFGALMAHEAVWLACSRRPRIYRVTPDIGEIFNVTNASVDVGFVLGMMKVVDMLEDENRILRRLPWCDFDQLRPDGFEDQEGFDDDEE